MELKKTSDLLKQQAGLTVELVGKVVGDLPHMGEVVRVLTERGHTDSRLLEVLGPVFCNTTRHFLLIQVMQCVGNCDKDDFLQGQWSLDVENAWLSLFRDLACQMKPTEYPSPYSPTFP